MALLRGVVSPAATELASLMFLRFFHCGTSTKRADARESGRLSPPCQKLCCCSIAPATLQLKHRSGLLATTPQPLVRLINCKGRAHESAWSNYTRRWQVFFPHFIDLFIAAKHGRQQNHNNQEQGMTRLGNAGTSRTNNFRVGTAREEFVAVITQTFGAMRAAFLRAV